MIGALTWLDTRAIILSVIALRAPLPASMYITFIPSISPAMAVHMAISSLSAGMGVVLLIYDTVVGAPPSITIYPVDIISRPLFLTAGADRTCCPINNSGLRPDITDRYNKASA